MIIDYDFHNTILYRHRRNLYSNLLSVSLIPPCFCFYDNFYCNSSLMLCCPQPLLIYHRCCYHYYYYSYYSTALLKILQLSVKHMIASTLMQRQDKTRNAAAQTMPSPSYPPLIMVWFFHSHFSFWFFQYSLSTTT